MSPPTIEAVVFDIGGVLLDWDPRHLYRSVFGDEAWSTGCEEMVAGAFDENVEVLRELSTASCLRCRGSGQA